MIQLIIEKEVSLLSILRRVSKVWGRGDEAKCAE
jgi:hypothetical protein